MYLTINCPLGIWYVVLSSCQHTDNSDECNDNNDNVNDDDDNDDGDSDDDDVVQ